MTAEGLDTESSNDQTAERLSHALYGLIILTAALGAEVGHITEVVDALGLLFGTAIILLLAHTYSAVMAERAVAGHKLGTVRRRVVVIDNVPVLFAVLVPALLFVVSTTDLITLRGAYVAAIVFNLALLFGIGIYEGVAASMSWPRATLSGLAAGAIGLFVILLEAFFD